jgi:hypothetical protein
MNPGYFPEISDLEFGIVKKQISYHPAKRNQRCALEEKEEEILSIKTITNANIDYSDHTKFVSILEKEMLVGPINNKEYIGFREQINNFIEDKVAKERADDHKDKDATNLSFSEPKDPIEIFLKTEDHPKKFNPDDIFENLKELDLYNSILCNTCLRVKVERSHHCRQCGKSVLKMDHHCPWLATCIGFRNYKFFCLVHYYGVIVTFTVFVTFWEAVASTFVQESISIPTSCFILYSYLANIGLMSFLIWLLYCNIKLVFSGQTVIEQSDRERFPNGKIVNNYDLGYYRNFTNVFGTNPLFWFFPIYANYSGDGIVFERSQKL